MFGEPARGRQPQRPPDDERLRHRAGIHRQPMLQTEEPEGGGGHLRDGAGAGVGGVSAHVSDPPGDPALLAAVEQSLCQGFT
ncbi:hypothetical protein ASF39_11660 [Methylobacterium sp. Leaf108]|nr:hypothetical protein ASF39_11660 [Methylobacterium sp. Leaf108]